MQISIKKPSSELIYSSQKPEPITLKRSELPTNSAELAEIASRCPVKILYSETKGKPGHPWGHTALEINGKVYSYGRWGKVDKNMGTTGEGALFIFDSYENYAKSESGQIKQVPIFGINSKKRTKIEQYFLKKIEKGTTINGHRLKQEANGETKTNITNYQGASEYIIDDYNVFDQNCTTISLNALESVGGEFEDIIESVNLESKLFESIHDNYAIINASKDTLRDLNISISTEAFKQLESLLNNKELNKKSLPINENSIIINTGTKYDGQHIIDIFYKNLTKNYGVKNIRLPKNLYEALNSPDTKISSLNLNQLTNTIL